MKCIMVSDFLMLNNVSTIQDKLSKKCYCLGKIDRMNKNDIKY